MTTSDTPPSELCSVLQQAIEWGVQVSFLELSGEESSGCGGGGGSQMTSTSFPVLA